MKIGQWWRAAPRSAYLERFMRAHRIVRTETTPTAACGLPMSPHWGDRLADEDDKRCDECKAVMA